jgi:hypothetical protein
MNALIVGLLHTCRRMAVLNFQQGNSFERELEELRQSLRDMVVDQVCIVNKQAVNKKITTVTI